MSENPDSKDNALKALDFLITVLREHEQNLDKLIDNLATVSQHIGDAENRLNNKVDKAEEKISNLQKELTNLTGSLTNPPKQALTAPEEQESHVQATTAPSTAATQVEPSVILYCTQWTDFQALAMHAQKLFFNYKEAEKVFHTDALKENQIITYTGALPDFSAILKIWLLDN